MHQGQSTLPVWQRVFRRAERSAHEDRSGQQPLRRIGERPSTSLWLKTTSTPRPRIAAQGGLSLTYPSDDSMNQKKGRQLPAFPPVILDDQGSAAIQDLSSNHFFRSWFSIPILPKVSR
jgi:hypothetical protein